MNSAIPNTTSGTIPNTTSGTTTPSSTGSTTPSTTASDAVRAAVDKPLSLVGLRPAADVTAYRSVPWYRRQWFALFPLCAPLLVVIALTGGVYVTATERMKRYSDADVWQLTPATRFVTAALAALTTVLVAQSLWG